MLKYIIPLFVLLVLASCTESNTTVLNKPVDFDAGILRNDIKPVEGINGQLVYLPVYSNIPYLVDTTMFDMSAFVAVHNTDLYEKISLTNVLYFDQKGRLVDDFLKGRTAVLDPLETRNFYIPYEDKSGTGANFLIEWISDTLVSEPLLESVTLCLKPNNTLAISSRGRVIRQGR